jgi:hypothetical protein
MLSFPASLTIIGVMLLFNVGGGVRRGAPAPEPSSWTNGSCFFDRGERGESMDVYTGMVLGGLIFLASVISVEVGISAAIVEIVFGVIGGNFLGMQQLVCVKSIAGFGGVDH